MQRGVTAELAAGGGLKKKKAPHGVASHRGSERRLQLRVDAAAFPSFPLRRRKAIDPRATNELPSSGHGLWIAFAPR